MWSAYECASPAERPVLLVMRMRPELERERVAHKDTIAILDLDETGETGAPPYRILERSESAVGDDRACYDAAAFAGLTI